MSELQTLIAEGRAIARIAARAPRFRPGARWNAARCLRECARRWPDGTALLFEDRRYAWREIDHLADRTANAFRRMGVEPGDSVALLMDNRPEYVVAVAALSRLRARAALINTNVVGDALSHALKAGLAAHALVGAEHEGKLAELGDALPFPADCVRVQRDGDLTGGDAFASFDELVCACSDAHADDDVPPRAEEHALYIYTSGTTGLPKAAVVSNAKLMMAGTLFGRGLFDMGPDDTVYVTLPLYHSNGMYGGVAGALQTGATIALRRKFSASQFWSDVRRYEATAFIYIGELLRYLLNQEPHPKDGHHRLRVAVGNGLRPDIWQAFQQRFQVPLIREFYGATEGIAAIANITGRVGMVGRLQPGQVIARCDPLTGELWRGPDGRGEALEAGGTGLLLARIGGPIKFDGYVDEAASRKKVLTDVFADGDAYFDSGDLLDLHEGRWLSFADRVGDTFRWKGENVSTNEVAEILNGAVGVLEANVYGVGIPGADGKAGMASLNVADAFDLHAFEEYIREKLPAYMRPYFIRLQREMRVTGTFKHQKTDYRKEGYDPSRVEDPLYFLDGEKYVPVDQALFDGLQSGTVKVR